MTSPDEGTWLPRAGFLSFQSLLGSGVVVAPDAALCVSAVQRDSEGDRVCARVFLRPHSDQNFRLVAL